MSASRSSLMLELFARRSRKLGKPHSHLTLNASSPPGSCSKTGYCLSLAISLMIYFYTRTLLSQEGRLASNLSIPVYARLVSSSVNKHLQHCFVPKECLQLPLDYLRNQMLSCVP